MQNDGWQNNHGMLVYLASTACWLLSFSLLVSCIKNENHVPEEFTIRKDHQTRLTSKGTLKEKHNMITWPFF